MQVIGAEVTPVTHALSFTLIIVDVYEIVWFLNVDLANGGMQWQHSNLGLNLDRQQ